MGVLWFSPDQRLFVLKEHIDQLPPDSPKRQELCEILRQLQWDALHPEGPEPEKQVGGDPADLPIGCMNLETDNRQEPQQQGGVAERRLRLVGISDLRLVLRGFGGQLTDEPAAKSL
jgi:hypothetical protein